MREERAQTGIVSLKNSLVLPNKFYMAGLQKRRWGLCVYDFSTRKKEEISRMRKTGGMFDEPGRNVARKSSQQSSGT
jgi:hypothetical protein